jgi:hypothetical protein
MKIGLAFVAFALLLSGCFDSGTPAQPAETGSPTQSVPATVLGRIADDEARPLGDMQVTLVEATEVRMTDENGSFAFEGVAPGTYTLVATHPEYEDVVRSVQLAPGDVVRLNLTTSQLPDFRPFSETLTFRGKYDCAAEYLIITGDCGIAFETVSCAAGSCTSDPVFSEAYQFKFEVRERWETILLELAWTSSLGNGLDGMRMYLENTNVSAQGGHAKKVGRVDSDDNPMALRIDRGTVRTDADFYDSTTERAFVPDEASEQQVRVFPKGQAWQTTRTICEPTRGCLLGVGAGVNIDFDVYVTVFYNMRAPDEFSAVPA